VTIGRLDKREEEGEVEMEEGWFLLLDLHRGKPKVTCRSGVGEVCSARDRDITAESDWTPGVSIR
jgi:hypothetical protein